MEVRESEWKQKAIENITLYVHRGGDCQGDEPQLLGGANLLNTIGVAMGLTTTNPKNWSNSEFEKASKGQLVFYEGDARKAIDVIADQIRSCCGGDDKNFVTVLPIELYFDGKLYELPLLRVKRGRNSRNYYVDNVGRCYDSADDWFDKNKLPPGMMAYPTNLKLALASGSKKAKVSFATTPSARLDAQAARGLDGVAAVAGLGASVALLFVSGGLAAPLVVTAVGAASYGTGRAGYQLVDRATHGENVNPFTDSQARMLWLGIAANLTSFGAMGATMRLTSLAARGRDISTALRIIAEVANGTNVAVSGFAILNSTIFMIENHENLTAVDILMHGASIAFWTKGLYCYKTTNVIIQDAQNHAFASLSKNMNREEADQFSALRNRVGNDAKLLQKFHAAMKANISVKEYSQLMVDGMHYYDTVSSLTPDQIEAFDSLRAYVGDDMRLIAGLRKASTHFNMNRADTVEMVLQMWQKAAGSNANDGGSIVLRGGNLILGSAPPIKIDLLPQLSPSMIKFFGEHLSRVDPAISAQWVTSVPVLLKLQSQGMFKICPVTKLVDAGCAVVLLNDNLEISIHRLHAMTAGDCQNVFEKIARLPAKAASNALPPDVVKLCVRQQRLRFECHRIEATEYAVQCVRGKSALSKLIEKEIKSHERDRLYTFMKDVELVKGDMYMSKMMAFVADMKPTNISEMVAYAEFAMVCVEDVVLSLKQQIKDKTVQLPARTPKTVWTRSKAAELVLNDTTAMKQKYAELHGMVSNNDMVGVATVERGLSDEQLVRAARGARVRFGAMTSAVYHVAKRPTTPPSDYVNVANRTINNPAAQCEVTLSQAGDARFLRFDDADRTCIVLERDGRLVLCTFIPK